jgi:hypothetical protein
VLHRLARKAVLEHVGSDMAIIVLTISMADQSSAIEAVVAEAAAWRSSKMPATP